MNQDRLIYILGSRSPLGAIRYGIEIKELSVGIQPIVGHIRLNLKGLNSRLLHT